MPDRPAVKLAYLTAGAAGMYCGSCMHDNTLASALTSMGVDAQLIPTYTPIRTDEHDVSVDRVFFGGVNIYLQQRFPLFRHLPGLLDRVLDQPWFLRWVTSRGMAIAPKQLGELTVSMLKGEHGYQRKEVKRLCRWLASSLRPDVVVLTNILIGGCIPELKRTWNAPVWVTLQGDDVFLDYLPEPYQAQALAEVRRLVNSVDGFLVHTQFYADFMQEYLDVPADRLRIVPLGIDGQSLRYAPEHTAKPQDQRTIGYLARLAPEKGLHVLVDAFIQLRQEPRFKDVRLDIAGWLGQDHREYAEEQFGKLKSAGLEADYQYHGSVDRAQKLSFLHSLDLFSVPSTYRDPKGIYVLESMAAGVPVVEPNHGAFPELLAHGGGRLVTPNDSSALAAELGKLLNDDDQGRRLGEQGQSHVLEQRTPARMARETLLALEED